MLHFSSVLFLFLVGEPFPEAILDTVNFGNCNSCHGGILTLSLDQAFSVQDPDNGFATVTEYVPGENYRLRLQFNPINSDGRFEVAYRIGVFDRRTGSLKKGEMEEPTLGDRLFNDDESYLANIINTATIAEAQNAYINWTAPEDGFDVIFFIARLESNQNGTSGGDRASGGDESVVLTGPNGMGGGGDGSDDGSGDGSNGDTDGSSSGSGDGSNTEAGSSFAGGFAAGCSLAERTGSAAFWLGSVLMLFLLVFAYRQSSEKNS